MDIRFKLFSDPSPTGMEEKVNRWLAEGVIPHDMRLELTTHNNYVVSFLYTPKPDRRGNNSEHI